MVQSNIDKQTEQAMYLSDSFDFASADPKTKRNLFKNLGADDQFKEAFNLKLDKQADTSYSADENVFRKKAFDMGKALGFDSRNAQLLSSAVDYLPFVGTPSGVNDIFTDLKNKHYVGATINVLATAASVLPAGKAIVKSLKDASQPLNMIVPNDRIAKNTYDNLKSNLVELPNPSIGVEPVTELKKVPNKTKKDIIQTFVPKTTTEEQIRKDNLDKIAMLESLKDKTLNEIKKSIPNFSTLFKGSKMVDDKGNPIILYRGIYNLSKDPTEVLKYKKSITPEYPPEGSNLNIQENKFFGDKPENLPYGGKNRSALDRETDALNLNPKDYGLQKGEVKRKQGTVFASTNIKQAIGYSRYNDSKSSSATSYTTTQGILPFYVNASQVIEHVPISSGIKGMMGKKYNWNNFDDQAEELTGSQVLIYKSDTLVDTPSLTDAGDRLVTNARKQRRVVYNSEQDQTTIVAFGPDVQIIPAVGRVPELDRLGLKSQKPTKTEKLQKTKILNESIINNWKKQAQEITSEIARKKDLKQMDDTYPEIPSYNLKNRFVNDPKLIDSGDIAEMRENTGPFTYTEDELYKGERGSKIKPEFPEYAKGGEVNMAEQTEMAFMSDSIERDPVSGNEVPIGSLAKEVRDDVPAMLSEGEYVVPADVVRFYGVKFFEDLRMKAKLGLQRMDETGRIGGEPVEANKGGIIHANTGVSVANTNAPLTAEQQAEKEAEQISASVTTSSANTGYTAPIQPPSNQAFMQAVGTPLSGSATKSVLYINPQGATLPILLDAQGNPMFGGPPAGAGYVSSTSTQGQQLMQQYGFASADTAAVDTGTSTEQITPETVRKDKDAADVRKRHDDLMEQSKQANKISAGRIFGVGENGEVSAENLAKYNSLTGMEKIKLIPTELGQMFGGKIDANEQAAIDAYVASPNDDNANFILDVVKTVTGISAAEYVFNKISNIFGSSGKDTTNVALKNPKKYVAELTSAKKLEGLKKELDLTKSQLDDFKKRREDKGDDGKGVEEFIDRSITAVDPNNDKGRTFEEQYGAGLNKGALVTKPKRKPRVKRKSLGQK